MNTINKQREIFIKAAIPFVLEHGWSEHALREGSKATGEKEEYWGTLFPNLSDAVAYFEMMEDELMLAALLQEGGVRSRIAELLKHRIKHISGGKEMLLHLKEFYLQPHNIAKLPKVAWQTSDIIWKAIGDKSTDMNYYSKRLLLSGAITAAMRHYLSDNGEDIDQFIKDSLDKIVKIAGFKKYLKLPKLEDIPILRLFS